MNRLGQTITILTLCLSASGCNLWDKLYAPKPRMTPVQPLAPEAIPHPLDLGGRDGSLWTGEANWSWVADHKALRSGDILLVEVSQSNSGSKDASTETSRTSSISASIRTLFGYEDKVDDLVGNRLSPIDAESSSTFDGDGKTERKDDLTATVSAVVTEVLANGNLVIYGHQIVQVNNESSLLTVQGIVRPADITQDNRISSNRIANAVIEFNGAGVLSETQRVGVIQRAFHYIWPL